MSSANSSSPGRPTDSEHAPFYSDYVRRVGDGDVMQMLERQPAEVEALLGGLDDERTRHRYAADKWSVREVLGHMSDTERVMSYRLLRIARGDSAPSPSFDQDDYVRGSRADERTMRDLLDEFRAVRASSIALMRGLDGTSWTRRGMVSNAPMSARALAFIIAGHAEHHVALLRERYGVDS